MFFFGQEFTLYIGAAQNSAGHSFTQFASTWQLQLLSVHVCAAVLVIVIVLVLVIVIVIVVT